MLRRWAASGKVAIAKTPRGKRLYSNTDVHRIFGGDQQPTQKGQRQRYEEESKKWWLPERFEFNYLFALIFNLFIFYFIKFFIRADCVVSDPSLWEWVFEKSRTRLVVLGADVSAESSEAGTRFRSSRFLWQDITGCVPKIPAGKTQRICLLPAKEEKLKLRRWIGTARWTYDRCLVAIETPYDIRDEAMTTYLNHIRQILLQNGNLRSFVLRKINLVVNIHFFLKSSHQKEPLEYDSRLVMIDLVNTVLSLYTQTTWNTSW
jgi:hypothetical protein